MNKPAYEALFAIAGVLLLFLGGCAESQKPLDEQCVRVDLDSVGVHDYVRDGVLVVSWHDPTRRKALYIDLVVPPKLAGDLSGMTLMADAYPAWEPRCGAVGKPEEDRVNCAQSIPGTGRLLIAKFHGTRADESAARMATLIRYVRDSILCE